MGEIRNGDGAPARRSYIITAPLRRQWEHRRGNCALSRAAWEVFRLCPDRLAFGRGTLNRDFGCLGEENGIISAEYDPPAVR
jgi:hypothetical protein